ncbi:dihydrofolate reductase [Pedobacter alpinus]|uniref:Dihydrofolate reductase n=1 Tax=Pedobacter alpinus TaxID=1590643 RepID=A0ABW5TVW9_9SPHI
MNNNQDNQIPEGGFKGLSLIVATDEENGIGKNNQLLWHLPNDLKFFKKVTSGHTIIMGRKTYDSIGKPLPNRRNIVISRQANLQINGVEIYPNLDAAIASCKNEEECFVIGGGEIYKQALPFVKQIYLTKVASTFNADTFFPTLNEIEWEVVFKEEHQKDEKHAFDYAFLIIKNIS